jgi:hypothetical protein
MYNQESMAKEYIEERDGNYYIACTRISLDSIVHAFRRGESPETICLKMLLARRQGSGSMNLWRCNRHRSERPAQNQ